MKFMEFGDQSVEATMLLPLWGRAKFGRENPHILRDREAESIIARCGVDFSAVERGFNTFSGICFVVRARKIEDAIRAYIRRHPNATVVDIGCGLDTAFSRVDNGTIRWYNLDLPAAIAFRRRYIPDEARCVSIGRSLLDPAWMDEVHFQPEDGIFLVAGGVFYYFGEEQLRPLFCAMAERFPGGELYFDAESPSAVKQTNRKVRRSGNGGAPLRFALRDIRRFARWSPHIRPLSDEPIFWGLRPDPRWRFDTRMLARAFAHSKKVRLVHLRFVQRPRQKTFWHKTSTPRGPYG